MASTPSKAEALSAFAADLTWERIPPAVRERAKLQILDAVGTGIAATAYPFATRAVAGVKALGGRGDCSVIGETERLSARDAALANGMLMHGLDFDDTHLGSIIHASVACLPAALAMGEATGASGRDVLVAYIAGMETAIRIGLAANGAFHHAGYHATALASHFSSAIIAGKLMRLDADALTMAQGIAGSSAAGIQVFLEEGAWTKRFHPGWGAVAGITAATLAQNGFVGPRRPYEGKFGLFETHFQEHIGDTDIARLDAGLGERWVLAETAIKPYPVCHFIHGAADAAIELSHEIDAGDIVAVEALLPEPTLPIVAEPHAAKIVPTTDYEAKFSAQFVLATCLAHGRFGLAELQDTAFSDRALLDLAAKVACKADPDTAFPTYFSGGVVVTLKDGRRLAKHVPINSGAGERALDVDGVSAKYRACAAMAFGTDQAERVREIVLQLDERTPADLGAALRPA
ncbi:MAG: MmgE/PrpD family protein [Alphaproteobacteria bacterium]|nr:MmgE/PrpD family protein [Alphaproteobacteria bacterium]MCB9931240.1 MmgE/PrpD family protein [Alphaproteobacteria bacterium]